MFAFNVCRKVFLIKTLVFSLCYLIVISECHIAEILFEDEDDTNMNHFPPNFPPRTNVNSEENNGNTCHIEFQVTKRAIGHCMKLGKTGKGCVSGTYIYPYHSECL